MSREQVENSPLFPTSPHSWKRQEGCWVGKRHMDRYVFPTPTPYHYANIDIFPTQSNTKTND